MTVASSLPLLQRPGLADVVPWLTHPYVLAGLVVAVVAVWHWWLTAVGPNERGVVWRSGEVDLVLEPGVYAISPFGADVETYDLRPRPIELRDASATTSDGWDVRVDADVFFRFLDAATVARFLRRADPDDDGPEALARDALRSTVAELDLEEALDEPQKIVVGVCDRLGAAIEDRGMAVYDAEVLSVEGAGRGGADADRSATADARSQ